MDKNELDKQNSAYSQGQPYEQPVPAQPARAVVYDTMPMKNNNMAIVGMILGIFSLLGCWVPVWNLIFSIGGIISSAIGLARKQRSGMAIAGLVSSIIALLISIVILLIYAAAIMATAA